jgi:UDP-N-acetylglucosamine--N-acetylmuramyl-(pentapeptide) pyrophosphoryl-undecaprenol N-acetylglucosamine transferase
VVARRDELAKEARGEFVLEPDLPTVVVFGGSQGALALDRTVAGAIPLMAGRSDIQFLVLTGRGHGREMSVTGQESPVVRALEFLDRMELVYAVADVAVARAGAGSIAEISVCGVPSLLVPYPQATGNHQEANARELERAGGAEVLLNADLTPEALVARLTALLADGPRRERMGDAARAWSKPEAASRLARLVVEAA